VGYEKGLEPLRDEFDRDWRTWIAPGSTRCVTGTTVEMPSDG
jgi:hypothetical protein